MKKRLENVCSTALSGTLKVVNPIKKTIIKTDCEVHLFIQKNALDILKDNKYINEYNLFIEYSSQINRGLVWADQDFKSYSHFYNPRESKGLYASEYNALDIAKFYYKQALIYYRNGKYEKSMFYFGASAHIIQDLTIPQHAKGKLLDNHRQFELYVKSNYKKIKRFKSYEEPLILNSVEEYANYNSLNALKIDYIHRNINDLNTKFYLIALNAIKLAQTSTAGYMIMFYNDLFYN
ncbi:MAG: zinc dependent phospholipase C family protein [Romboutsia sp.]|nr:zinc dependent phospholipase C family protein [Romboutsia sp.]